LALSSKHASLLCMKMLCAWRIACVLLGTFWGITFLYQLYCNPLGFCKNARKAKQVCFNPDFIGFILKVRISILGVWVIRSWDVIIIRVSFIVLKNYKSVLSTCSNITASPLESSSSSDVTSLACILWLLMLSWGSGAEIGWPLIFFPCQMRRSVRMSLVFPTWSPIFPYLCHC
jgi:hypothetical protein